LTSRVSRQRKGGQYSNSYSTSEISFCSRSNCSKRQFWSLSGFAIETRSSADYRAVKGQLQKRKKRISIRGLNQNHNHDLKNLFKGAAG